MQMVEAGIVEQASLSLRHVGRVLKAVDASCGISDAIRVTCYMTSAEYIDTTREIFLQACVRFFSLRSFKAARSLSQSIRDFLENKRILCAFLGISIKTI